KSRELPVEMAELTGEMVREARSRAKRSSGEIKALPRDHGDSTTVKRKTSSAALSPHRDGSPGTRKHAIVQNPEMDEESWQSYAAKSFPTFERDSIMDGSARQEVARTSSNIHPPGTGALPPVELAP